MSKTLFGAIRLGYLVIGSTQLDDWHRFAAEGLGLHVDRLSGDLLGFRLDDELAEAAGAMHSEIRRAARTRGLSCPLDQYLETTARRHDTLAVAFRLAACAARGEALQPLVDAPLEPPPQ